LVVPEEVDNIDAMLAQFKGREEELLQTLRTMQERSVTVRARAAVHKSKGRPVARRNDGVGYRRDAGEGSVYSRQTGESETSRGSAAGSAAIAAASIPRPATGRVPIHPPPMPAYEPRTGSDGSSPESGDGGPKAGLRSTSIGSQGNLRGSPGDDESGSESGSYTGSESGSGSYSSGSGSYTGSSASGSMSGSGSGSGSYTSRSGSESGSGSEGESYDSGSLQDLPSRWKSDEKKQPWQNKESDDYGSQSTENDRHQPLSTGHYK
jgi:hypothetical protein